MHQRRGPNGRGFPLTHAELELNAHATPPYRRGTTFLNQRRKRHAQSEMKIVKKQQQITGLVNGGDYQAACASESVVHGKIKSKNTAADQ
jgi:hypothetical protein